MRDNNCSFDMTEDYTNCIPSQDRIPQGRDGQMPRRQRLAQTQAEADGGVAEGVDCISRPSDVIAFDATVGAGQGSVSLCKCCASTGKFLSFDRIAGILP